MDMFCMNLYHKEQSSVACVTDDFAMQNVILQMGLCLVEPEGCRFMSCTESPFTTGIGNVLSSQTKTEDLNKKDEFNHEGIAD
ncbi:hypothetical protein RND71_001796 [Anisodus tanguticus]|uniref:Uncharacterized protein n=1 Tax=Anisodus tanguticus TaxID=243964 RepID=A0AAE1SZZ1_9SOLA|nr:hypothetical protein RND71_001796 [Anisodus tanguticus]